jgi:hypothetical protein
VDDEEGTIWLEDVGHTDFDAHLTATGDLRTGYLAALDTLAQLQRATRSVPRRLPTRRWTHRAGSSALRSCTNIGQQHHSDAPV